MSQQDEPVKILKAVLDGFILRAHLKKTRTNYGKLPSDLYTHSVACMCAHILNKCEKNFSKFFLLKSMDKSWKIVMCNCGGTS